MPWEGYNYEDAILDQRKSWYRKIFYTSIHIEKFEIEARQTKLGPEEITREIPNVSEESVRQLDENRDYPQGCLGRIWRHFGR